MREIYLRLDDHELFDTRLDPDSYNFIFTHLEAFKHMWNEQSKAFWCKHLTMYRHYCYTLGTVHVVHKDLKPGNFSLEHLSIIADQIFIVLYEEFVAGHFGAARELINDIRIFLTSKSLLLACRSSSIKNNPFYMTETRDVFRKLAGCCRSYPSGLKDIFLNGLAYPIYSVFGASIYHVLRRWIFAREISTSQEKYLEKCWECPPELKNPSLIPLSYYRHLLERNGDQVDRLLLDGCFGLFSSHRVAPNEGRNAVDAYETLPDSSCQMFDTFIEFISQREWIPGEKYADEDLIEEFNDYVSDKVEDFQDEEFRRAMVLKLAEKKFKEELEEEKESSKNNNKNNKGSNKPSKNREECSNNQCNKLAPQETQTNSTKQSLAETAPKSKSADAGTVTDSSVVNISEGRSGSSLAERTSKDTASVASNDSLPSTGKKSKKKKKKNKNNAASSDPSDKPVPGNTDNVKSCQTEMCCTIAIQTDPIVCNVKVKSAPVNCVKNKGQGGNEPMDVPKSLNNRGKPAANVQTPQCKLSVEKKLDVNKECKPTMVTNVSTKSAPVNCSKSKSQGSSTSADVAKSADGKVKQDTKTQGIDCERSAKNKKDDSKESKPTKISDVKANLAPVNRSENKGQGSNTFNNFPNFLGVEMKQDPEIHDVQGKQSVKHKKADNKESKPTVISDARTKPAIDTCRNTLTDIPKSVDNAVKQNTKIQSLQSEVSFSSRKDEKKECEGKSVTSVNSKAKPATASADGSPRKENLGRVNGPSSGSKAETAKIKKNIDSIKKSVEEQDSSKPTLQSCSQCRKMEEKPKSYKKCARCKSENVKWIRYYCSRECQAEDWIKCHQDEHEKNHLVKGKSN